MFIQNIATKQEKKTDEGNMIRIVLPLRDQIAARQLLDLSNKIAITLQPIFVSKKLEQDLKPEEIKLSIVNQQCVGYKFAWDLCDADYIGYTGRHLHQRIAEHKYSAIGKHLLEVHGDKNLLNEGQFRVLKKCHEKFDCLVYEMLFIKELRPSRNTQSDSISAKLFFWLVTYFYMLLPFSWTIVFLVFIEHSLYFFSLDNEAQ